MFRKGQGNQISVSQMSVNVDRIFPALGDGVMVGAGPPTPGGRTTRVRVGLFGGAAILSLMVLSLMVLSLMVLGGCSAPVNSKFDSGPQPPAEPTVQLPKDAVSKPDSPPDDPNVSPDEPTLSPDGKTPEGGQVSLLKDTQRAVSFVTRSDGANCMPAAPNKAAPPKESSLIPKNCDVHGPSLRRDLWYSHASPGYPRVFSTFAKAFPAITTAVDKGDIVTIDGDGSVKVMPSVGGGYRGLSKYRPLPLHVFDPVATSVSALVATLQFAAGSSSLNARDRKVLQNVVALRDRYSASLRIIGHASSRTATMSQSRHDAINWQISEARAHVIGTALMAMGVAEQNIYMGAVADTQPLYEEVMPSGEAGNRRAEIYLDY